MKPLIYFIFVLTCFHLSAQLCRNNALQVGVNFIYFQDYKDYHPLQYQKSFSYTRNWKRLYAKIEYERLNAERISKMPWELIDSGDIAGRTYKYYHVAAGYNIHVSRNLKHCIGVDIGYSYRKKSTSMILNKTEYGFKELFGIGYSSKNKGLSFGFAYSYYPISYVELSYKLRYSFYEREKNRDIPFLQKENAFTTGVSVGFRFGKKRK